MSQVKVQLGEHEIVVVPQSIGYINKHWAPQEIQAALNGDLGDQVHALLTRFIPGAAKVITEWELAGYPTKEAWKAGDYDEATDPGITYDELLHAIERAIQVSGGERIKNLLGADLLRRVVTYMVATNLPTAPMVSLANPTPTPESDSSGPSVSSPATNGASASTDSGTSAPTPEAVSAD